MREWVINDLTGDHAVVRHLIRGQIPFVPIYVIFLFFPGELWLRLAMVALAALLGLFFSAAYMEENRIRRLVRHGLPGDLQNPRKTAEAQRVSDAYLQMHHRDTVEGDD